MQLSCLNLTQIWTSKRGLQDLLVLDNSECKTYLSGASESYNLSFLVLGENIVLKLPELSSIFHLGL